MYSYRIPKNSRKLLDKVMDFLTGANLKNAIANQTHISKDWAEFYEPNGNIVGKAKIMMGLIKDYTGTWTVNADSINYYYPEQNKGTDSKLTLDGDTITFYDLSGQRKKNVDWLGHPTNVDADVAKRKQGNALRDFK